MLLDVAEDVEQVIGFGIGERGRRLVEDENLALEGERAGDLEQLAMGGGERLGGGIGIDPQIQAIENRSCALPHLRLTKPASRAQFPAGKDVGGDAQVREREHLLVDHADATIDRVARAGHLERGVAPANLAGVRPNDAGEDLEQRRFARAVLADNGVSLALGDLEAHSRQGADGPERLADVTKLEPGHEMSASF